MRGRWAIVGVVGLAISAAAVGQDELPPLALPSALDSTPLGGGIEVSRPLHSVSAIAPVSIIEPATVLERVADPVAETVLGPLGRGWDELEYLLAWPSGQPSLGGGTQPSVASSGGRFRFGAAVNDTGTIGYDVRYTFVAIPTQTVGSVDSLGSTWVSTHSRIAGWEIGGIGHLYSGPGLNVNATAGYRYFALYEGLSVEQYRLLGPTLSGSADDFGARTRFHGGQMGLRADFSRGPAFVEVAGAVALGQSAEAVTATGKTAAFTLGVPGPQVTASGVLVGPANAGRFTRSAFAVLPEASVKVGCRLGDRSRAYVGYTFLYLSDVARPADALDASTSPGLGSEFWVQGLTLGLECRY